jgi:cytochrome c peroxidase
MFAEVITPIEEVKIVNKDKVMLGKKLFFDTSFSKDETIACVSCHSDFGADSRVVSLGVDGKKGNIQSLSVFNAVNNFKQFWNGRAANLNEQIDGPVYNSFEMDTSKEEIEAKLNSSSEYTNLFSDIYSKKPSYELFKDAIVAFQKTLVTPDSKFDLYLKGEKQLTQREKRGFKLFKNYGCAVCHNGVNVGGNSMQLIGSIVEYPYVKGQADLYSITQKQSDKNVFRVPSLRNISKTAPYFHDGSAQTLQDAVEKMAYHNLGTVISEREVQAIIEFLKTLDGKIPTTWINDVQ